MTGENESAAGNEMTNAAGEAKQALTNTAQETVETAKDAGKEIADTAREQITETVDQAVSQTADTVAQVKGQANSVFVDQRDRAASSLAGLAEALRETGKTLQHQAEGASSGAGSSVAAVGPFIHELADRLESSSDYLKDIEVGQLISDAEDLARRQPLLFVGALFGVGMVGARLLKGTLGDASGSDNAGSAAGGSRAPGQGAVTGQGMRDTGGNVLSDRSTELAARLATGHGSEAETGGRSAPSTLGTSSAPMNPSGPLDPVNPRSTPSSGSASQRGGAQ